MTAIYTHRDNVHLAKKALKREEERLEQLAEQDPEAAEAERKRIWDAIVDASRGG